MSVAEPMPGERRRVRRSRKSTPRRPWRNARVGPWIFGIMTLLTLAYIVWGVRAVDYAGRYYGWLVLDLTRADVRYLMGPPIAPPGTDPARLAMASQWRYQLPEGGQMTVGFDPASGRIAQIACEDVLMAPASCPGVLGLDLGASEDAIWMKLGVPSDQSYIGDVKLLSYRDIGVTFALRRYAIYKIVITDRAGSPLTRGFRFLVP